MMMSLRTMKKMMMMGMLLLRMKKQMKMNPKLKLKMTIQQVLALPSKGIAVQLSLPDPAIANTSELLLQEVLLLS